MKKLLALFLALAVLTALVSCDVTEKKPDGAPQGETPQGETPQGETPQDVTPQGETPQDEPPRDEAITVADAVNLRKYMPLSDDLKQWGYAEEGEDAFENFVILPALTGTSEAVAAFNDKIFKQWENVLRILQNGEDVDRLYGISYQYKTVGTVVGIIVQEVYGAVPGGVSCGFAGFYFDTEADRELTFDEYLAALGTDRAAVTAAAEASKEFREIVESTEFDGEPDLTLSHGISDESSAFLCFESDNMMMDNWLPVPMGSVIPPSAQ